MTESIITISIVGLLTGLVFSMPIAGPISILITTNALKGRLRYCALVNIGASFATFTYVFFAVFGLTKLYPFYKPAIPYLLSLGSIFLLFLGYKIFRTKIDIEHFGENSYLSEKIKKKERGGFYTGCIINFLNPTLFIGWLTSTFLVISFVSSLGFNTGGLKIFVDKSVKEISSFDEIVTEDLKELSPYDFGIINTPESTIDPDIQTSFPKYSHLVISVFYALFISLGSIIWFYILASFLVRFRRAINIMFLSGFIKSLGVVLCLFGLYFGYLAAEVLFSLKI
ncbi:MAG: LysE family transporter [Bacteroidales bacterium]|jgi:threonine/homoserine/homoserine lactone efflux protein|nr:LysE family transporter [Bacteroidales bacterium]